MAYDTTLAEKIRTCLIEETDKSVVEKTMFGGLAFMVNGKMCINVSGNRLMCRFDPSMHEELSIKPGFESVIMKGKLVIGYCYVNPEGFKSKHQFEFWLNLCLQYNNKAKASKKH